MAIVNTAVLTARDFYIAGEVLVCVRGRADSAIGAGLFELGLSASPIQVSLVFNHKDIIVDAWGSAVPPEVQFMNATATISMNLVHYDQACLEVCLTESMGGAQETQPVGTGGGIMSHAGARLGNNLVRFAPGGIAGNHYIGLNLIAANTLGTPTVKFWRFFTTHLMGTPVSVPLGTEKSVTQLQWRAIPYAIDPFNGGAGALGTALWDHGVDQ